MAPPSLLGTRPEGTTQNEQRNLGRRVPLLVFAASSLRGSLEEVGALFHAQGRPEVRFNFASSSALARQLEASSEGEVFVSADESWVDHLAERGRVAPGTRRYVLSNTLAIVAHPSSTFTLDDPARIGTLGFDHLSIADPDSVPAGRYARDYLRSLRMGPRTAWDTVSARVAPASDVRAALAVVATQADALGIVYRSDARTARVRVLYEVPVDALPTQVRYTAVAVAGRERTPLATRFVTFLTSDEARSVFERHGFILPPIAETAAVAAPAPSPVEVPLPPDAPPP